MKKVSKLRNRLGKKEIMDSEDAAEFIGVHVKSLYRYLSRGLLIPAYPGNRPHVFKRKDLEMFRQVRPKVGRPRKKPESLIN